MAGRAPTAPALTRSREREAWALACEGQTHAEIATKLGVNQSTVTRALKRIEHRVITQLSDEAKALKATQLARLEHIYGQAMGAWQSSKQPRKKSRHSKLSTLSAASRDGQAALPSGIREETVNAAETSDGNFSFLETALHALGDQRKLLGLDAPKKIDHTLSDQRRPLVKMTPQELAAEAERTEVVLKIETSRLEARH